METTGGPDTPQAQPPAPPPPGGQPPVHVPEEARNYPAWLEFDRQPEYVRLLPLVKWLLAIPHYLVLFVLGIGVFFALIGAFFAVLFTRRYPRGIFDFVVGVLRWGWRVAAYVLLLVDEYPPFTLDEEPGYPARLRIDYPEQGVDRWRPPFAWILALPYLFVANVLQQLAHLLTFFAFFVILFTKKYPEGMFRLVEVALRWQVRGGAYALWMTTRYPPFVWG
jgi:Domain of unknown function (DUF4389)